MSLEALNLSGIISFAHVLRFLQLRYYLVQWIQGTLATKPLETADLPILGRKPWIPGLETYFISAVSCRYSTACSQHLIDECQVMSHHSTLSNITFTIGSCRNEVIVTANSSKWPTSQIWKYQIWALDSQSDSEYGQYGLQRSRPWLIGSQAIVSIFTWYGARSWQTFRLHVWHGST